MFRFSFVVQIRRPVFLICAINVKKEVYNRSSH
jgi:hypothetical protein